MRVSFQNKLEEKARTLLKENTYKANKPYHQINLKQASLLPRRGRSASLQKQEIQVNGKIDRTLASFSVT